MPRRKLAQEDLEEGEGNPGKVLPVYFRIPPSRLKELQNLSEMSGIPLSFLGLAFMKLGLRMYDEDPVKYNPFPLKDRRNQSTGTSS